MMTLKLNRTDKNFAENVRDLANSIEAARWGIGDASVKAPRSIRAAILSKDGLGTEYLSLTYCRYIQVEGGHWQFRYYQEDPDYGEHGRGEFRIAGDRVVSLEYLWY